MEFLLFLSVCIKIMLKGSLASSRKKKPLPLVPAGSLARAGYQSFGCPAIRAGFSPVRWSA